MAENTVRDNNLAFEPMGSIIVIEVHNSYMALASGKVLAIGPEAFEPGIEPP